MFGIGMWELMIVFVVALLIFGPKRLPDLARTLGKGLAEFRRASYDLRHSFNLDAEPPPPRRQEGPDPRSLEADPGKPDQAVDGTDPTTQSQGDPEPDPVSSASTPSDGDPDGGEEAGRR